MKILNLLIPSFRVGLNVELVNKKFIVKGNEEIYALLNPDKKYKEDRYGNLKEGKVGMIVSMAKYNLTGHGKTICYGVLHRDKLYAVAEEGLSRKVTQRGIV